MGFTDSSEVSERHVLDHSDIAAGSQSLDPTCRVSTGHHPLGYFDGGAIVGDSWGPRHGGGS